MYVVDPSTLARLNPGGEPPIGAHPSTVINSRRTSGGDSGIKVWLITCTCRALVQALAEAVLASGHNLVAAAVNVKPPLRELAERYGDQLRIVPIEVTDGPAADGAIEATVAAFGRIDVLVLDLAKWRSGLTDKALLKVVVQSKALMT